jgi:hypothetical protein
MRLVEGRRLPARGARERPLFTEFEKGVMVGLLIGEGHFGGDGRQPQITLRMHVRHEALFKWIEQTFPGGKLYGPYNHDGRQYLQWMARGSYLRDVLMPVLDDHLTAELDVQACHRFREMKARYHSRLGLPAPAEPASAEPVPAELGQPAEPGQRPDEMAANEREVQDPPPSPQTSPSTLKAEEIFERLRRERPT